MKFKTLAFATTVASVLATQIRSQSTDDVRRAIMGHEAFMERCADDLFAISVDALNDEGVTPSKDDFDGLHRKVCDNIYDGINVCVDGDASDAMGRFMKFNAEATKFLRDPLTRADKYEAYERLSKLYSNELEALKDLRAGETSYCDVADQ